MNPIELDTSLLSLLPPWYREVLDYQQICLTEQQQFEALAEEHDVIVLEGAGSPAEINLRQDDIVNMGMARRANAPVLLCGDIDRGGVFASLYGTVKLLEPDEQARIKGLIINKFRGDVDILRPGLGVVVRRRNQDGELELAPERFCLQDPRAEG